MQLILIYINVNVWLMLKALFIFYFVEASYLAHNNIVTIVTSAKDLDDSVIYWLILQVCHEPAVYQHLFNCLYVQNVL